MESKTSERPTALSVGLALAAVYLAWGSTYLAIRIAIATIPPFLMAAARFCTAGAILFIYGMARLKTTKPGLTWAQVLPTANQWKCALWAGTALLCIGNGGVVWSEQRIASGLVAIMLSVTPLFMVLLDKWISRGDLSFRVGMGLFMGTLGIALLVKPNGSSAIDPVAATVVLLASFSWAAGSLYARQADLPKHPLVTAGMEMLAGGLLLLVIGVARGEWGRLQYAALTAQSVWALIYLIVVGSLVGFTAYSWLLSHSRPAVFSTYSYVNPLVAVFLGWLILHEPLTMPMAVAGALVVAAVVIIVTAPSRPAQSRNSQSDQAA